LLSKLLIMDPSKRISVNHTALAGFGADQHF